VRGLPDLAAINDLDATSLAQNYAQGKLANILFITELAKRLNKTGFGARLWADVFVREILDRTPAFGLQSAHVCSYTMHLGGPHSCQPLSAWPHIYVNAALTINFVTNNQPLPHH
jgi:hypothetical protein